MYLLYISWIRFTLLVGFHRNFWHSYGWFKLVRLTPCKSRKGLMGPGQLDRESKDPTQQGLTKALEG
jgi:hypothetical protein